MAYITLADVRAEGVTVAQASDAKVNTLIDTYQAMIETITRQWFEARTISWDFDGNGTTLTQWPVPIISVTNLYVNEDFTTAVDADDFKAYTGRGGTEPDDRPNPKVRLVTGEQSIFTGTGQISRFGPVFEVGEMNCRLEGSFGYTEQDGSTPEPIRYAHLKMVVQAAVKGPLAGAGLSAAGPVVEEESDRHRREFADPFVGSKLWPISGSGDVEVDLILSRYRAPMTIRAPRTTFRRYTGRRIV